MTQLTPYKCLKVLKVLLLSVPRTFAFFLVLNMMRALAPDFTFRMMKKKLIDTTGTWRFDEKVKSVEDIEFIFSFATVKVDTLLKTYIDDTEELQETFFTGISNALKEAQKGSTAPNPELYDLNTRKVVSLLSRSRPGRPLVINFGSCS